MSSPAPEPGPPMSAMPPAPGPEAPEGGPLTRVEEWAAKHLGHDITDLRADLADIRIKAERADGAVRKLAPALTEAVSIIQEAVKVLDPADAPAAASLIARAEALAVKAAEIGAELAVVL